MGIEDELIDKEDILDVLINKLCIKIKVFVFFVFKKIDKDCV